MSDRDDDDDRPRRRRPRDDDRDDDDDRPRARRRDADEDEGDPDDRPRRRRKEAKPNGAAVAALVLGILSPFCTVLTAIPAVIFGIIGLSRSKQTGSGKGMAIAGMVVGVLGSLVIPALVVLSLPAVGKVREAAGRSKSTNNLKLIGIGTHSFSDTSGYLPTAGGNPVVFGGMDGRADPSLSWRVALLPYVEQDAVYRSFKMDQPWDGPTNRPLADLKIATYLDPRELANPATGYRGFVGPGTVFEPDRNGKPVRIRLTGIEDGTSNTILAVEAADKVPWPQTKELPFDPVAPLPPVAKPGQDVFLAVMCDGSVRAVRANINPQNLKDAITRSDGRVVSLD